MPEFLEAPAVDGGELLLRLHQRLVQLHASLDEASTLDRDAHLRLLHVLRGVIDAIQANEQFRVADARRAPPQWPVHALGQRAARVSAPGGMDTHAGHRGRCRYILLHTVHWLGRDTSPERV